MSVVFGLVYRCYYVADFTLSRLAFMDQKDVKVLTDPKWCESPCWHHAQVWCPSNVHIHIAGDSVYTSTLPSAEGKKERCSSLDDHARPPSLPSYVACPPSLLVLAFWGLSTPSHARGIETTHCRQWTLVSVGLGRDMQGCGPTVTYCYLLAVQPSTPSAYSTRY